MPDLLISAGQVVTPARTFAPGWVHVEGDRVAAVGPGEPPRPADVDLPDGTVVPGFVDTHVHGGGGASFDGGDPVAVERAVLGPPGARHDHDAGEPGHRHRRRG